MPIWHFWFPAWNLNFLCRNTFIGSALNVTLAEVFKNVSQFLPNPWFRLIQVKKCLFSIGHIFASFLLLFKSKISDDFCPSIFLHFWMVWGKNWFSNAKYETNFKNSSLKILSQEICHFLISELRTMKVVGAGAKCDHQNESCVQVAEVASAETQNRSQVMLWKII